MRIGYRLRVRRLIAASTTEGGQEERAVRRATTNRRLALRDEVDEQSRDVTTGEQRPSWTAAPQPPELGANLGGLDSRPVVFPNPPQS